MALVLYWYDSFCFAIIAGAIFGSLWMLWKREFARISDDKTKYESLLVDQSRGAESSGHTRSGHVGSTQLWTSCWKGVHPVWLLASRGVSCAVMAGILAWDIKCYSYLIFVYYTEWTFLLVIVYFALGTVISAHGCWVYSKYPVENTETGELLSTDLEESTLNFSTNKTRSTIKLQTLHQKEENERGAGFWGYMMQAVYQTCAGGVMLTDLIFWGLIVPFLQSESFSLDLLMGLMHSLNAFFLLLDTVLNNLSFPWFRIAYFVLWSCIYVIFQWVIHACGLSWWPYPFLTLSIPWAPLWYFCLSLIHVPCYGVYALIIKGKQSIFSRLFPNAYVGSQ